MDGTTTITTLHHPTDEQSTNMDDCKEKAVDEANDNNRNDNGNDGGDENKIQKQEDDDGRGSVHDDDSEQFDDDDDDFDDEDDYSDDDDHSDHEDGVLDSTAQNGDGGVSRTRNVPSVGGSKNNDGIATETSTSEGQKNRRRENDDVDDVDGNTNEGSKEPPPKRAKIAIPPAIPLSLLDVDEYKLDEPAPSSSGLQSTSPSSSSGVETTNSDVGRINTTNLILFGLHPLVKEGPLQKLCERYGTVTSMTVRSAFANRYGHVGYESIEQAKTAYVALNGAKLFQKTILVQPTAAPQSSSSSAP